MKIVAIVQARMGSTRLPGKVLKDLAGEPILARVVNRVRMAHTVSTTVVATSVQEADNVIAGFCERNAIPCFRGSESDVLDRYYCAAEQFAADAVVRITADCPLIDPGLLDEVVDAFVKQSADYACNDVEKSFPRGLDVEVMSRNALATAWREAKQDYQRMHVTPYLYQNPYLFRCLTISGDGDYSGCRWTVDTAEDLEFVRAIYASLAPQDDFGWRDVLALLEKEPQLAGINCAVQQKALEEG